MPQTGRIYLCARCRAQVLVCRRCDRGQIYCTQDCARQARRTAQQGAAQRYQSSHRGRLVHAERSRRYRARRAIVTHQGSTTPLAGDLLRSDALSQIDSMDQGSVEPAPAGDGVAKSPSTSVPSCKHCGVLCPGGVRLGFVRHHPRPFDLGQTDRSIRLALQPKPHDHFP